MNQETLICDATCETSDLIQKIYSSRDIGNLIDDNNDDLHVSLSCYETQNDDSGDIPQVNLIWNMMKLVVLKDIQRESTPNS
jgi:hypothetical protein